MRCVRAHELWYGSYPTIEVLEAPRGFISEQFIQPAFLVREFRELCTVCADAGERREGKGENSLDGVEARELERSEVRGEDGGRGEVHTDLGVRDGGWDAGEGVTETDETAPQMRKVGTCYGG